MDQKISIKIAGRTYNLTASSPEQEELYRLAADTINKRMAAFTHSHPGKTAADLMTFVALTETVIRIGLQKNMESFKAGEAALEKDLERYLQDCSTK
jgi:cell division protein ZapA (FtsZ GTPase activity inhibitor)